MASKLQIIIGVFLILSIAFLLSENKKEIKWRLIIIACILENLIYLSIQYIPAVHRALISLSEGVIKLLDYSNFGANFIFGELSNQSHLGFIFAITLTSTLVFLCALISIGYFFNIIQTLINILSTLLRKTIKLSGLESIVIIADIFVGGPEAAAVIAPYISKMTRAELACMVTAGFANLSGTILGIYLHALGHGNHDQELKFASLLLTALFMNACSAIIVAKMMFPEQHPEQQLSRKDISVAGHKNHDLISSIVDGAFMGLKISTAILVVILAIIPIIHLLNNILASFGDLIHINQYIMSSTGGLFQSLSLEYMFGIICRPFAFLLGVNWQEALQIGSLIGQKIAINEFVAFSSLGDMIAKNQLSSYAVFVSTFVLASFANFSSVGIISGVVKSLAPNKSEELSSIIMKCLLAAILASFITASVAGLYYIV